MPRAFSGCVPAEERTHPPSAGLLPSCLPPHTASPHRQSAFWRSTDPGRTSPVPRHEKFTQTHDSVLSPQALCPPPTPTASEHLRMTANLRTCKHSRHTGHLQKKRRARPRQAGPRAHDDPSHTRGFAVAAGFALGRLHTPSAHGVSEPWHCPEPTAEREPQARFRTWPPESPDFSSGRLEPSGSPWKPPGPVPLVTAGHR